MPRSCSSWSPSVSVVPWSTAPDAMLVAAEEQHPLGDGGFAGVDVGDDADVAEIFNFARHGWKPLPVTGWLGVCERRRS